MATTPSNLSSIPSNLTTIMAALSGPAPVRQPAAWRELAACRRADPELFFPLGSGGAAAADIQRAKAVCASCPVRRPCLTYATLTRQEFGIWGGCDESERRQLHAQWRQSRIDAEADAARDREHEQEHAAGASLA